jgi:hypothetical protein
MVWEFWGSIWIIMQLSCYGRVIAVIAESTKKVIVRLKSNSLVIIDIKDSKLGELVSNGRREGMVYYSYN